VWEAWAHAARIFQWFTDGAEGEARTGSTITWIFEKFGDRFLYEVFDAQPGERLVLTGQIPGRPRFFLEITIASERGHTRMSLVNSGFLEGGQWDEKYEGVDSGWRMSLATLKVYLERYFSRPRRSLLILQPADYAHPRLRPYRLQADGLAQWLGRLEGSAGLVSARRRLPAATARRPRPARRHHHVRPRPGDHLDRGPC
jgi:uncharacterized protein YndB with AHSA1/START domain